MVGLHAPMGVASGPVGNATVEKIAPTAAMKILLSVAEDVYNTQPSKAIDILIWTISLQIVSSIYDISSMS